MSLKDLYDLLLARWDSEGDGGEPPSYVTLTREYNTKWAHCLKFRPCILQSKCDPCERLKLLRKRATTPEAAVEVRAEHLEHIKEQFLDRAVDERVQHAAFDAVTTPSGVTSERSILNADIDAMEAQKFKCPRNLGMAKALANLWRPQQHMVGCVADGIADYFWLIPPDVVKNANLSATLTADMLHHAAGVLEERGVPIPQKFRVHSDNAGGEVKNQIFMKYMAFLAHGHFTCTEMTQFRPGHSHGRVDQKFTVVGTALNRSGVLQTPDDFQTCMEGMTGNKTRGRRVTQLGALYDWNSFFDPLQIAPHSHVQSHAMFERNEEACHVFRFFRRSCLNTVQGSAGWQPPHSVFDDPPADDDIILVTKHYLGSETYAQQPEVFCPGARFRSLPAEGPQVITGRIKFSLRQEPSRTI